MPRSRSQAHVQNQRPRHTCRSGVLGQIQLAALRVLRVLRGMGLFAGI